MTLRDNLTQAKAWAHGVLDDVRAGFPVHSRDIRRALCVLGDLQFESGASYA